MERWLSGRKRLPAKKLYWDTGIMGSNPILSAREIYKHLILFFQVNNPLSIDENPWLGAGRNEV